MIETNYGTSATAGASAAATQATAKASPANKEMFMQLLVAQIKNQNPMSPADGVQFLTQLAQFTELEQLTGMRADMAAVRAHMETPDAATAAGANTSGESNV